MCADGNARGRAAGIPWMTLGGIALALWACAMVWWSTSGGDDTSAVAAPVAATVDVNSADAVALQVLPGIGLALSQRIVDDRAKNGPFRRPEDLLRVRGVTEELVRRIRPFLADAGRVPEVSGAEASK